MLSGATGVSSHHDVDMASNVSEVEAGYLKLWSVRTVISLVCFAGILLSAGIAEVLSELSCDAGLEDTRDMLDNATAELGAAATSSIQRVAMELLVGNVATVNGLIYLFLLGAPRELLRTITTATMSWDPQDYASKAYFDAMSPWLWGQVISIVDGETVFALAVSAGNRTLFMAKTLKQGSPRPILTMYSEAVNATAGFARGGYCVPGTGLLHPLASIDVPFAQLPHRMLATEDFIEMGNESFRFSHLVDFGGGAGLGYLLVARLPDPTGRVPQIEVVTYVNIMAVQMFLKGITHQPHSAEAYNIIRAYTTIASSWVAERMRALRVPNWKDYDQAGVLTGVSHGQSDIRYPNGTALPIMDVDATDPYIRAVSREVGGNYASLVDTGQLINVTVNNTDEELVVGVARLPLAHLGMDWWCTSFIDSRSVLEEVRRTQSTLTAKVTERKEDVENTIYRDRLITNIIIACVGLALIFVSIVTSWYILKPLREMQVKMDLVANMDLDDVDTSASSTLYELRRMQRDFRKMVENLTEFRAYVPSAVLESSGYSGAGGMYVVEPPTGNVAIVFTDIKGSTELWKSSAGDMNAAMEIHNEVMRDACKDFDGYEVKTIGDAFMVSFSCPVKAAKFSLAVQTKLALRKWPDGLTLPDAGMVVRIGVNYGPTIAEENPVTGRVDYRGSTVNLASRVEAKAKGGTICLSDDMYTAVRGHLDQLDNPAIHNHGLHDIKGLGNGHQLYLMVPSHMRRRFSDSQSDCVAVYRIPQNANPLDVTSARVTTPRSRMSAGSPSTATIRKADGLKNGRRTDLRVTRCHVTVAVCRLQDAERDSDMFDNCNIMVRSALEAAHATDGVIGNVTGRTLTVVWNASKKCAMHSTAALMFVSEMKKLEGIMQVGLATGTMLHGNVGTKTSRFATAFGKPLEAAEAMTDHASMFGVYCLYADCTADKRLEADVAVHSCLRLVDAWKEEGKDRLLNIYEVHVNSLTELLQGWSGLPVVNSHAADLDGDTQPGEEAPEDLSQVVTLPQCDEMDSIASDVSYDVVHHWGLHRVQGRHVRVALPRVSSKPQASTAFCDREAVANPLLAAR